MELLILALFGTAILGAVAFNGSDDDDTDQPDEAEQGQEITYDGSDLLEGTEGDDTIAAGQDAGLAPDTINLLGGDDTAVIEVDDTITVSGGDGDDVITATGVLNTLEGGAGNDTLTGDDSNQLLGGEGDDVLTFNHGSYDQGDWGSVDGGEGDDIITVRADALVPDYLVTDVGGVNVSGGNGSDEINIIYDLAEDPDDVDEDTNYAGQFVTINDFDPNADSLVVEVERDADTADREIAVTLDQTAEEDGAYTSLITLTFEETETASEATNILRVVSLAPFTLDDIQLVTA